jgi:hypothetical protein
MGGGVSRGHLGRGEERRGGEEHLGRGEEYLWGEEYLGGI